MAKYNKRIETVISDINLRWADSNEKSYYRLTDRSNYVADWVCQKCGGVYAKKISEYVRLWKKNLSDCPYCRNQKPLAGYNTIDTIIDNIDEVWSEKNDVKYTEFLDNSFKSVYWKCPKCKGHFKMLVIKYSICRKNNEETCPYCTGKRPLAGLNSLETVITNIDEVWSDENEKSYTEYLPDSWDEVKWKCPRCHNTFSDEIKEYITRYRAGDETCVYCSQRKALPGFNTLETLIDDIDDVWAERNYKSYTEYTTKDVNFAYFKCMTCGGTEFLNVAKYVGFRLNNIKYCGYCAGRYPLSGFNTIETVMDNVKDVWSADNKKSYSAYLPTSNEKVKWVCDKCGGSFSKNIDVYIKNWKNGVNNCPYCTGKRALAGFNTIETIVDDINEVWSDNNNRSFTEISESSYKTAEWRCPVCKGSFEKIIRDYVKQIKAGGNPCPYCAGKKALTGFNSLETVIENIDDVWGESNEKSYTELLLTSSYVAEWKCYTCHGVYKKRVSNYVKSIKNGKSICPYCNNKEPLAGFNTIETVNPDWLEEWSYRDNYLLCRPDEIAPNSAHKVWWKCKECGYIYKMAPKTRAMFEFRHRKSCPRCKGLRRKKHYI